MYYFRRQCDETNVFESEAGHARAALSLKSWGAVSLSGPQFPYREDKKVLLKDPLASKKTDKTTRRI